MLKIIIDSMKRLYEKGSITKDDITQRVVSGKLTPEEYKTITGEEYVA